MKDYYNMCTYLLQHADKLWEGPVELSQERVEELRRVVQVWLQYSPYNFLEHHRRARLCMKHHQGNVHIHALIL